MKKIKIISAILASLMLISVVSCTNNGGEKNDDTEKNESSMTTNNDTESGESINETESETEPEIEDVDLGTDFITGPKSLERLLKDNESVKLNVNNTANAQKFDAFGTEWDPHFFRYFNSEKGCDEEDWALITKRIKTLGIQKVRMMVLPGWYEHENDNDDPNNTDMSKFTFDSEAFTSLLRYLDVCEENGIKVNLTVWGVNLGVQPDMAWLSYSDCGDWISAPTNREEFAENVSALLTYLINEKKYTCVKELTLYNEPDWAFKGAAGAVKISDYFRMCTAVHERLTKDGLRDKIKLILCDDAVTDASVSYPKRGWFEKCVTQLDNIADGYDTHVYAFNSKSEYEAMKSWAKGRNDLILSKGSNKQYTHNEFGSNMAMDAYNQADIDTYDRGLLLSKLAVATLNGGSAGMLYWVTHDVRYNDYPDSKVSLMKLGLFGYKEDGWKVRPIYHAWGLIMNNTVPGSEVYGVENTENVSAVAMKSPEGKWTYIVNNDGNDATIVNLNNSLLNGAKLNVYIYSQDTVSESEEMIESAGIAYTKKNDTYVYIPANSFVVLSEN